MKTTILSASLLLLLSSCTPTKTTNNLNAIDIAGSFEHLTELKVSQLGKNIRYVPLETTDSSLTSFPQLFYPLMTRHFFCDFHEKSEDFCVS